MKKMTTMAAISAFLISGPGKTAVPTLAQTFSTDIYVSNGTTSQRDKIFKAEEKIRNVIHSEEFKNRVINFTYNGQNKFVDNGGLTNTQIYYKILNGAEKLLPEVDNELDLKIKTYYSYTSTVGYTSSSSMYINMNTRFLNKYSVEETAKTMVHEWLHKLGFTHAKYYSTSRNYSVPYGIGKIVLELAAKY